jgi:hypothetical protein
MSVILAVFIVALVLCAFISLVFRGLLASFSLNPVIGLVLVVWALIDHTGLYVIMIFGLIDCLSMAFSRRNS